MKAITTRFSSWIGVLAVATGILAPRAFAYPWCPNVRDYVVTCSGCTVDLICNVQNTSIWIYGDGVTFNGHNYSLSNAPGPGIKVYGTGAHINDVNVLEAGQGSSTTEGHGLYFNSPYRSGSSFLNNVYVYHSKAHGVYNASGSSVQLQNCSINGNGGSGVVAGGAEGAYTDIYSTGAQLNNASGYVTVTPYSYIIGNWFYTNGSYGSYAANLPGLLIQNNQYYSNYRGLVLVSTTAPQVQNNSGGSNYAYDCFDYGSSNGIHSGNSWSTAYGPNCRP